MLCIISIFHHLVCVTTETEGGRGRPAQGYLQLQGRAWERVAVCDARVCVCVRYRNRKDHDARMQTQQEQEFHKRCQYHS